MVGKTELGLQRYANVMWSVVLNYLVVSVVDNLMECTNKGNLIQMYI